MSKIKVTITVDGKAFERFKKKCEKNDTKASTKINTLIKKWVESK